MIKYRQIKPEEITKIHNLISNIFHEFIAPDYSQQGINTFMDYISINNIKNRMKNNHFILAAISDNEIIGIIEMRNFKHISLMFVDKKYHKQGVAKKLFSMSIDECKKKIHNVNQITVNSSPFAVQIYEKLGFIKLKGEEIKDGIRYIPMKLLLNKG